MLPTWLAPNLITLIGITGLIVAFLVTATMVPEIQGETMYLCQSLYKSGGDACTSAVPVALIQ